MNQILKRQTSHFHYGSKVPAVTITIFITILEQNRWNSCQSSIKFSEEGGTSIVNHFHQQPRVTWSIVRRKWKTTQKYHTAGTKEATFIPLAHKYSTAHFLALYRHFNKSGGITLILWVQNLPSYGNNVVMQVFSTCE